MARGLALTPTQEAKNKQTNKQVAMLTVMIVQPQLNMIKHRKVKKCEGIVGLRQEANLKVIKSAKTNKTTAPTQTISGPTTNTDLLSDSRKRTQRLSKYKQNNLACWWLPGDASHLNSSFS